MKILKVGDWHLGVKQDDPWVQKIQLDGVRQMIEYSKAHEITNWLQAGDVFDVRKAITHKTMKFARQIFSEIADAGITTYVCVGNHDMNFKDKIHPNACTELLSHLDQVHVIDKATTIELGGIHIDLFPWICDENRDEIYDYVKNSLSRYCMGHFEFAGFYFYKGLKSHGSEPDFLRSYKRAWSGHFHTISENRNVTYLGTPWSLTSGDENDPRGWWIFDTETEESVFVQNSTMWHRRIDYPCSINPETYRDLSVRLFVTEIDKNLAAFETALESVVHDLKVVSRVEVKAEISDTVDEDSEIMSMPDLINAYIDAIPDVSESDVTATKAFANELYIGALK